MSSYTNDAGEPIMSGAAWRYEQSLDDEHDYDDYDDYYEDDYEDDGEDDDEELDETIDSNGNPLPRGRCDTCGAPCTPDIGDCSRDPAHVVAIP